MKKFLFICVSLFILSSKIFAQTEITEKGYFYSPNGFVCQNGNIYTADMKTVVRFGYLGNDNDSWNGGYSSRNELIIPEGAETIPSHVLCHPTPFHYLGGSHDCSYIVLIPFSVKYIAVDAFDSPFVRFYNYDSSTSVREQVEDKSNNHEVARYNLQGQKVEVPERGINIVQMSDNSSYKELIK